MVFAEMGLWVELSLFLVLETYFSCAQWSWVMKLSFISNNSQNKIECRGVQILTNSNKNCKLIQKKWKLQKIEFFWMCLDILLWKSLDRISDLFFKTNPNRIKPHTYILILINLFISMKIYCINLFFVNTIC
jgi:hypothetical protein